MLGWLGVALCFFMIMGVVLGVTLSNESSSEGFVSPSPSATSTPSSTPTPTPLAPGLELYLLGTGEVGSDGQGDAVSFSRDGSTLAVGGPFDDSSVGATWVFTQSGDTWVQQGNKLVGTGSVGGSRQGSSVAISADGNTLAVGGNFDNSGVGATWIFTRSGDTWTQQGNKLVGTGNVGNSQQGFSVAISDDGNTVAVGGNTDDTSTGATWVFTRSGSTWTQQGSKLVGTGGVGISILQGESVALSSDGNTLAVGGRTDDSNTGATWVFTRSGTTWTQQGGKLVGTGGVGSSQQGDSVALSSDGNTLAVGAPADNTGLGTTWIFTRSGTTWTQQGGKLVGTGNVGNSRQGTRVTLDSDGNTLALAGQNDNSNGATWIFTRSGTTWTQQGSKIILDTGTLQGRALSFAGDAGYLGVGVSPGAWILTPPLPT